jgi:phosphoribosylanthranilate isomerase
MSGRVRFKVCCIASVEEARLAVAHGASALGLVSEMPSGPGVIDEATIAEVAAATPPGVATFLLTSRTDADGIVEQQRRTGCSTLQLCDHVDPADHARLRAALPGIKLVQVVHVGGPEAEDEARVAAAEVDALLLDTGSKTGAVKVLGGTGQTHDWSISRRIVAASPVPVFLAGGLRAHNVADAVAAVGPYGVDLCTGVRRDGALDAGLLAEFAVALGGATR